MAESTQHEWLDTLDNFELVQLQQNLRETMSSRGLLSSLQLYGPSLSSSSSRSPTLRPSVDSISYKNNTSGGALSLGSAPAPGSNAQRAVSDEHVSIEPAAWAAVQATGDILPLQTLPGGKLPEDSNIRIASKSGTPAAVESRGPLGKPPFFCTYCCEMGTHTSFKTKHDWKRHENQFHETGFEWPCQMLDCWEIFTREKDFLNHAGKAHGHFPDPETFKRSLPQKRAYACGFTGCRRLTDNWKDRCDHVARCMSDVAGRPEWSYSWRMLNLLRHPAIYPAWKRVKTHWLGALGLVTADLQWDCMTSRIMRQQLECHDFGSNVDSFLETFLKLGLPRKQNQAAPQGFYVQAHPASTLSTIDPALTSTTAFGTINTSGFHGHSFQPGPTLSYMDQRHDGLNNVQHATDDCVMMLDAPPLLPGDSNEDLQNDNDSSQESSRLLSVDEIICYPGYSANTTPPLSEPIRDHTPTLEEGSKLFPGCGLTRKNKERRNPRKSPRFNQRIVTDHPDLQQNYRVPAPSGSRRGTNPPRDPTFTPTYNKY